MDREEFNRVATKEEIERSRWIGEQRERGKLAKNIIINNNVEEVFSYSLVSSDELRPYTFTDKPIVKFTKGVVKGAKNLVFGGVINTIIHPVETAKGIWQAISHPKETLKSIGKGLDYSYEHGLPAALRSVLGTSPAVVDWEKAGEDAFNVSFALFVSLKGPQVISKTSEAIDVYRLSRLSKNTPKAEKILNRMAKRYTHGDGDELILGAYNAEKLGDKLNYIQHAQKYGGKYFAMPEKVYNKIGKDWAWEVNKKVLDNAIMRGDSIKYVSRDFGDILIDYYKGEKPITTRAREVHYLEKIKLEAGYKRVGNTYFPQYKY